MEKTIFGGRPNNPAAYCKLHCGSVRAVLENNADIYKRMSSMNIGGKENWQRPERKVLVV